MNVQHNSFHLDGHTLIVNVLLALTGQIVEFPQETAFDEKLCTS